MNHVDRINKLENCIKDVQEELNLLKADLKLPTSGGSGWAILSCNEVNSGPNWVDGTWVFQSPEEAEWTRRHELAWKKLRYYADKLTPHHNDFDWLYVIDPRGRVVERDTVYHEGVIAAETVFFHSREAAERALEELALEELGDDVNYLWSWNRKAEERAR